MLGPSQRCRPLVLVLVLSMVLPALPVAAGTIVQVTDQKSDRFAYTEGALNDDGSLVVFDSTATAPASNPLHAFRPTTVELPDGLPTEVTDVLDGAQSVSASDDGAWIACLADADPLGTNPGRGEELFVLRPDGSDLAQLTSGDPPHVLRFARISGNGERILFVSDRDPLGSNPAHADQLFLVDRDGTNLTQLTALSGTIPSASISDDATRVVFTHDGDPTGGNADGSLEVFAILSDGTDLRQLTSAAGADFEDAAISGDGGTVIAESFDPFTGSHVFTVFWDGMGLQQLVAGREASIRDDGQVVFFSYGGSIWEASVSSGATSQVTTSSEGSDRAPVVTGDGSRLVFTRSSSGAAAQLFVVNSDGSGERQLTSNTPFAWDYEPAISSDGMRIVFGRGPYLGMGNGAPELWAIDADGGNLTQLTSFGADFTYWPSMTGDGETAFFTSRGNDGPGYNIYRVQTDGSDLQPITFGQDLDFYPDVAADGSWVVFTSTGNPTGGNPNNSGELFRMTLDGADLTQIHDDDRSYFNRPRVNANGEWVVYQEASDFDGQNPDGSSEIFRARTDGSLVERLTADPVYASRFPHLTADGGRIVWGSQADPLGTNADHNEEIFLYETATGTLHQLTFTISGQSSHPRITANGAWVYFKSSAPFLESNPHGLFDPYRVSTATLDVERLGGLRRGRADLGFPDIRDWEVVVPSADGSRVVFAGGGDRSGQNPDRVGSIWLVDLEAQATIRPGRGNPTPVAWDLEPGPVRYDVIRGDVANLRHGAGSIVDLGPVACLGDNVQDGKISGGDALQPTPGQVLYYLNRGTQGLLDGPGSYGQGSGGVERVPAGGGCD